MNVLRQGYAAGVRKFMMVGSMGTIKHPKTTLSHKGHCFGVAVDLPLMHELDWNPVTSLDTPSTDQKAMDDYGTAKTLAELATWEWADQHPDVELTAGLQIQYVQDESHNSHNNCLVHPSWLYGPHSPGWTPSDTPEYFPLVSNILIANMLRSGGSYPPDPPYVDVRDAALAIVRGLRSFKPPPAGDRNRVAFLAPHFFDCGRARALILEHHPELESRILTKDPPPCLGPAPLEGEWIESLLNFKKEEFHSFEEVSHLTS